MGFGFDRGTSGGGRRLSIAPVETAREALESIARGSRIPVGASGPPFASDCAFDVLRGSGLAVQAVDAFEEALIVQAQSLRSPQNVNAPPLPCERAGAAPLPAYFAVARRGRSRPLKSGISPSRLDPLLLGHPALRSGSKTLRATARYPIRLEHITAP